MYSVKNSKLRVCASYLRETRNKIAFQSSRIILLQHLLPTTEALIYNLADAGADIHIVIPKPFSINEGVLERLSKNNFNVAPVKSYHELETTDFLDNILTDAISKCRRDSRKLLILEVGGYFAAPLTRLNDVDSSVFAGVVEDTTFGHYRYQQSCNHIRIPILSVARSRLKEVEAQFVGRDAVHATEMAVREIGESITGRNAVVVGYGMIGKNVARMLKASDLNVSVYDVRDHRNLRAFITGYDVNKKVELLRNADLVFAATGWSASPYSQQKPAVSKDEILDGLKDNAMLISVGSKDNEFDIQSLKDLAETQQVLSRDIIQYTLPNKKNVVVLKDGTAVNFLLPSIPVEVLDIVFSEIVLGSILLLKKPSDYPSGEVHAISEKYSSYIAKEWLRFVNHD